MARKLFCEYGPLAYKLSVEKEKLKRYFLNRRQQGTFARTFSNNSLPHVAASYSSPVATEIEGIPQTTVQSRANNIWKSAKKIDGLIVLPGETFSFWNLVGNCTSSEGYGKALVVSNGELIEEYGGGLCLVATLLHNLLLGTPLKVTELHHHSDALFPDKETRRPYDLGVSVMYNYIDYRFQNNSNQPVQIRFVQKPAALYGELRSAEPFPHRYQLAEENHFFAKEADGHYYRNSKIYRLVLDNTSGEVVDKELLHNNHSKVMYEPHLIPKALLRSE